MGFKGFNAFISKRKKYFSDFKLHDTTLILDGYNIACILYRQAARLNFIFNGDYDVYAKEIRSFFTRLLLCNIKPIVILDGGYELRKLNAVQARLLYSTRDIGHLRKEKSSDPFLPLLMIEVFKEVLQDMKIQFAQSRFEADDDIVKVAKYFKCPILSFDSDYYLCDADYIPYSSLKLSFIDDGKYSELVYIPCKIYHIDAFIDDFGGLPDKSYLSLLALVLGDYLEVKHFKKLYLSLICQENSSAKVRFNDYNSTLKILFHWFQTVESFDVAVSKIQKSVPLQFQRFLSKQLKRILNEQKVPSESTLINFLSEQKSNCPLTEELSSQLNTLNISTNVCENSKMLETPSLRNSLSPTRHKIEIPEWFSKMEMQGVFSRHVSNILNLRTVLLWTQMEDYSLPSAHTISFSILNVIAGIILSTSNRKKSVPLACYVRVDNDVNKECVIPEYPLDSISLKNLIFLPLSTRKSILLRTLFSENFDSDVISEDWSLFFLTTIFWFKNRIESKRKVIFLGALIYTFLFLNLSSLSSTQISYDHPPSKIELTKKERSGKYASHQNKAHNGTLKNILKETIENERFKVDWIGVVQQINDIKFPVKDVDKLVVHFFAEFQACFHCAFILNSLLNFPLHSTIISRALSGSLLCKFFDQISVSSSLFNFTNSFFGADSVSKNLFLSTLKFIEETLSCDIINYSINLDS